MCIYRARHQRVRPQSPLNPVLFTTPAQRTASALSKRSVSARAMPVTLSGINDASAASRATEPLRRSACSASLKPWPAYPRAPIHPAMRRSSASDCDRLVFARFIGCAAAHGSVLDLAVGRGCPGALGQVHASAHPSSSFKSRGNRAPGSTCAASSNEGYVSQ